MSPRVTSNAGLQEMVAIRLREELPGAEVTVGSDGRSMLVRVRAEMPQRSFECTVTEESLYNPDAPTLVGLRLEEMAHRARELALDDYGLRAELDRRVEKAAAAAAKKERELVLARLEERIDDQRDAIGMLPGELARIADWVRRELGS